MRIHDLSPQEGAKKNRKRVGRGVGSGHGRTSCRGHKGQKARSGGTIVPGFEGGQMPLQRRLPKRGFTNIFREEAAVVNLKDLNRFESSAVVDLQALKSVGLVRKAEGAVKILGKGTLDRPLTVKVNRISKSAKEKIESAGGKVELL
jgi:large subunit ribosomal protein L15